MVNAEGPVVSGGAFWLSRVVARRHCRTMIFALVGTRS